jgi:hypothetical protein
MEGILVAALAKFPLVEGVVDHESISGVLEVEQQRIVKVKGESDDGDLCARWHNLF